MKNRFPAGLRKAVRACRPAHDQKIENERRDALLTPDHRRMVEAIARQVLRRVPPAFEFDDLAATGELALVKAAAKYDPNEHGGAPFSAYARKVVRGAILDSIRRKNYTESTRPPLEDVPIELQRTEPTVEQAIDRERLKQRVIEACTWLSPIARAVIAMHYSQDETTLAEIAVRLGITAPRAAQILEDAIGALQIRLRVRTARAAFSN